LRNNGKRGLLDKTKKAVEWEEILAVLAKEAVSTPGTYR
jgi:hypothetical protein